MRTSKTSVDAESVRVDTFVRERSADGLVRAEGRVAEYLRTLGLLQEERVDALAGRFALEGLTPVRAVELAQNAIERFLKDLLLLDETQAPDNVDPLWLRAFIAGYPELFLGDDVTAARKAAARFGDHRVFKPEKHAKFQQQALQPLRIPGWLGGLLGSTAVTLGATAALVRGLAADGLNPAELLWAVLFAGLFGLGSVGFTIALIGFVTGLRRTPEPEPAATDKPLPRSALVMPIYEEDAEHVFAGLAAMRESLAHAPGGQAFEIFILSDSRRPEQVAEEERAFRRVARLPLPVEIPIYYRRRVLNERQKAGNLSEFFERFGHRYEYAIVLDADSLMRADTLVTMLRRMEAAPELALLQAPLELHQGTTIFARTQQLAASVCGPLFTRGLAYLSGATGNYYGHNAAIRTKAFLECCSLPVLDGQPPLGGHILSHDFVEAALLCRAGWEVRIAHDLGGSWEELPATLPDYVARDRRWCQGNLQHLRVALAQGFKPMSRMHMWVGAGAYLAGPAWLCFTVLGAVLAATTDHALVPTAIALPIMLATAAMLLGPRVFGVIATLAWRSRRVAHGGAFFVILSGLCELLLGSLLAPLMMVHHTRIVVSILTGSSIRWGAQNRRAGGKRAQIVRSELFSTFLGIAAATSLQLFAPQLLLWLAPIWAPLVLAIPLAMLVSSPDLGKLVARSGIFTTPSETEPDDLLLQAQHFRALTKADEAARFRDLVLDPLLLTAQLKKLQAAREDANQSDAPAPDRAALDMLLKRALRVGPAALADAERVSLAQDADSLRTLHREAWRHWPVESWQLARHVPQLPNDDTPPALRTSLTSLVPVREDAQ